MSRDTDPFAPLDRHRRETADHNVGRGRAAEDLAVDWLVEQGYEIVGRNVRTRMGEIDVVARDGETLCFVEIKARGTHRYGWAVGAVDRRKQRRLSAAALLYLQRSPHPGPCRFDVLGLDAGPRGWEMTLVRHAFEFRPPAR